MLANPPHRVLVEVAAEVRQVGDAVAAFEDGIKAAGLVQVRSVKRQPA